MKGAYKRVAKQHVKYVRKGTGDRMKKYMFSIPLSDSESVNLVLLNIFHRDILHSNINNNTIIVHLTGAKELNAFLLLFEQIMNCFTHFNVDQKILNKLAIARNEIYYKIYHKK